MAEKGSNWHYAAYGNTRLRRAYCADCDAYTLTNDGTLQCCGRKVPGGKPTGVRRMSIPRQRRGKPKPTDGGAILEAQENKCFYCGHEFGELVKYRKRVRRLHVEWDHVEPYSFSQNNHLENFVAACQLCNQYKRDKMFNSLESARRIVGNTINDRICEVV